MKTLGLIGGTGWVSTAEYYRLINEGIHQALGEMHYAKCIIYSLNYNEINTHNINGDYEGIYTLVSGAAHKLAQIGAEAILLCANTLHFFADRLEAELSLPLIHIAEATSSEIRKAGLSKVGLLGTRQTMEQDFYKRKLAEKYIDTLIPDQHAREFIQETIVAELFNSCFKPSSKARFLEIINKLQQSGAQGIILGCTEIPLLIKQEDSPLRLFDTLSIHASAAVRFSLSTDENS